MNELNDLMSKHVSWVTKTFGQRPKKERGLAAAYHMGEEVDEMVEALNNFFDGKGSLTEVMTELADVQLLIFSVLDSLDANMTTLTIYADLKHGINKTREWSGPDEKGIRRHIKE